MIGRRSAALLGAASALAVADACGSPARAADQEMLVRAVGQLPRKELVAALATAARPRTILLAEHPDYAGLTYAQIGEKLCGAVSDGYFDAVPSVNGGRTVDPASVAGADAFALKWPACFEVRKDIIYKVRKNDNPSAIRLALTGEFAVGQELEPYFAPSGINPRAAILQPGTTLALPFETIKTSVFVPSDQAANFKKTLETNFGRRVQVAFPRSHGKLIGPAGSTLGTDVDCTYDTDERYPFSALEVANAYDALRSEAQNNVYVAVVDNGFFGVPCTATACPGNLVTNEDFSPRFPRAFFARPSFYKNWGSTIGVGYILEPVNYRPASPADLTMPGLTHEDVNEISGHGTHVAGLVLGGPTFEPFRDKLLEQPAGNGRIELSIVAVARGTLDLESQTEGRIEETIDLMQWPMLVNLSISFDEPEAEERFTKLLKHDDILFVAAAGNDHHNLEENKIYPASLGGIKWGAKNLIVVASIDSTGKLSSFSNWGDHVDIAAPGCKISSWLDADRPDVGISGTSQAAPLVTFGAALLMSKLQPISPRAVKNRLMYSGDLIRDPATREKISSGVRLAIPKALFFDDDFIFVRSATGFTAYLGQIDRFTGVTCGGAPRTFDDIRSLKRASADEMWVYTETAGGPVSVCPGKLAEHTAADASVPVTLAFHARARLEGASILPVDPAAADMTIPASDLIELVRAMPNR